MVFGEMGVCVEISLYLILETCLTCDEDTCKEGSFISIYGQQIYLTVRLEGVNFRDISHVLIRGVFVAPPFQ